jgi:superfamily II DNA or RNA helicase
LLVSPTGSGKTFIGSQIAHRYIAKHATSGGRVVWVAHRDELIDQACSALRMTGLTVGARGVGASANVQVAMIQTLARRREAPDGTLVVLDEAHHYSDGAATWTDVARAYLANGAKIVGLTATPARADGQALHGFDALHTVAQIGELVSLGHLVPLRWRGPRRMLGKGLIARTPAEAWERHARGRRTVVFAPNVAEAERYALGFHAIGASARVVSDRCSADERASALDSLANGSLDVLCNVNVLTEGWDCPRVSCVIVGRRCGSQGLWIQMTGRGLRTYEGKEDCVLLDLCGLAHVLGRPDDDRVYQLDGEGITLAAKNPIAGMRLCRVCGAPLEDRAKCGECGKDHSAAEMRSVAEDLDDWRDAYAAALREIKPTKPAIALASMMRQATEKGWKPGAVAFRFKGIFKRFPDIATKRTAEQLNALSDYEFRKITAHLTNPSSGS